MSFLGGSLKGSAMILCILLLWQFSLGGIMQP